MGKLIITVKNSGKGDAFDVTGEIQAGSSRSALAFDRTISFGTIAAGAEVKREISIQAKEETPTADAALTVELKEANGFDAQPLRVAFKVKAFVPPQLVVADMGINDQSGNSRIEPMEMVEVTARIQNIGHGDARNVTVDVETGANVFLAGDSDSRSHFEIGGLPAGKFQDVKFTFYTNTRIKNGEQIPLTLRLREARPQFNASHPLQLAMNAPAKGTQDFVVTAKDAKQEDIHLATGLSVDVDSRIPEGKKAMENDVAVIIGNRHYTARGVPEVAYADRDAKIMREYMIQTFGFKTDNVIYEENATLSKFNELFGTVDKPKGKVFNWMKKGANLFIYYVGHGAPDLETQDAYFVPVDANPQYIATNGYRLQTFYANLGKIQAKKITVVIDACFSGNSDRGFLFKEISPALVKVKTGYRGPQNALVMTSAAEDQVSSWYKDKRHSLFTYYFLKGIQGEADVNSDGRITVGEMKAYLTENVPHMARRLNNVEQHPVIVGNDQEILVSLKK
ncbi:MAG: caspase family protein [Deltaproteobacteria bacterium]|nr:caspase family protein [Deltaproteobacteria bacterium]